MGVRFSRPAYTPKADPEQVHQVLALTEVLDRFSIGARRETYEDSLGNLFPDVVEIAHEVSNRLLAECEEHRLRCMEMDEAGRDRMTRVLLAGLGTLVAGGTMVVGARLIALEAAAAAGAITAPMLPFFVATCLLQAGFEVASVSLTVARDVIRARAARREEYIRHRNARSAVSFKSHLFAAREAEPAPAILEVENG